MVGTIREVIRVIVIFDIQHDKTMIPLHLSQSCQKSPCQSISWPLASLHKAWLKLKKLVQKIVCMLCLLTKNPHFGVKSDVSFELDLEVVVSFHGHDNVIFFIDSPSFFWLTFNGVKDFSQSIPFKRISNNFYHWGWLVKEREDKNSPDRITSDIFFEFASNKLKNLSSIRLTSAWSPLQAVKHPEFSFETVSKHSSSLDDGVQTGTS